VVRVFPRKWESRLDETSLCVLTLDVLGGGAPMTSEIARHVIESFHAKKTGRSESVSLTAREEETLLMLTKGYSNKEIADRLKVSIETVRTHLKNIYEKMHVRSRTEAVANYMSGQKE
jgi:DNA-binding NarL/FixJ family response regulator